MSININLIYADYLFEMFIILISNVKRTKSFKGCFHTDWNKLLDKSCRVEKIT